MRILPSLRKFTLVLHYIYDLNKSVTEWKLLLSFAYKIFWLQRRKLFPWEMWASSFVSVRNRKPYIFLFKCNPWNEIACFITIFKLLIPHGWMCVSSLTPYGWWFLSTEASLFTACQISTTRSLNSCGSCNRDVSLDILTIILRFSSQTLITNFLSNF